MKLRRNCDFKLVYDEYLKTPHWRKKRLDTLAFYCGECPCGSMEGLEIHHTADGYDELFAEIVGRHVFALCELCHERKHSKDRWLAYVMQPDKVIEDFGIGQLNKTGEKWSQTE